MVSGDVWLIDFRTKRRSVTTRHCAPSISSIPIWSFRNTRLSCIGAYLICIDEGNSSSRKTRQQVAYAQSLQRQAELAQAEEAMRLDWPSFRQGTTLSLVPQVQEENRSGHWQNANVETFGKKGKERIQRRNHGERLSQEEEPHVRSVVAVDGQCTSQLNRWDNTHEYEKEGEMRDGMAAWVNGRHEKSTTAQVSRMEWCALSLQPPLVLQS